MKVFTTGQIKRIDELTIINEPVSSVDLMERAAEQLLRWYVRNFDRTKRVMIFTGPGNNGGDGLALARLLSGNRFNSEVFHVRISDRTSDDWSSNFKRLKDETTVIFNIIENAEQFPFVSSDDIIVDAIFGSGLSRPVTGLAGEIIKKINNLDCTVISVDIPSGLFGENNSGNDPESVIKADFTLTFEFPKLSFMFPENAKYTGEWYVLPIGLNPGAIRSIETPYFFPDEDFFASLVLKRGKFDHKGKFGHGLLAAGSFGKMGASLLGAKAAMKTGIGLLTCHIPGCGYQILQSSVPEVMVRTDKNELCISDIGPCDQYNALGIGPGIGTDEKTQKAFRSFLLNRSKPMVIDADGLNILSMNDKWLAAIPENSVLTPHAREFERIAGGCNDSFSRLEKQIGFSQKYNCIVLLKGAFSSVTTPQGKVYFNRSGNPGMATAGSGDVLTGMILSLLAQGYQPETAALLGVYLHGLAGDIAASSTGYESLTASDIIDNISGAFLKLKNIRRD
jgi:ADP-dependent NAD(P)H-hydrate dehydratase / NAD(P)H-hydrate epimerase